MDRERARQRLSDYLDGELSLEDQRSLEALLAEDEALRAELEALRDTVDALGKLPEVTPSPDFLKGVQHKLRRKGKSPLDLFLGFEKKIPFEAVSILLLGILLALYLLLVVLPGETTQPERTPPPDRVAPDASARRPHMGPARP